MSDRGSFAFRTGAGVSRSRPVSRENALQCDYSIPESLDRTRWDPDVLQVVVGSVFDAYLLKSALESAVSLFGPEDHLASEVADELWELIVYLTTNIKLAESVRPMVCNTKDKDVLIDLLGVGNQTMERLRDLLNKTTQQMLDIDGSLLRRDAGTTLVEVLFGKETIWLMADIRDWVWRFNDAGKGIIIRNWDLDAIQRFRP